MLIRVKFLLAESRRSQISSALERGENEPEFQVHLTNFLDLVLKALAYPDQLS